MTREHDRPPCPRCGNLMGVGAHRRGSKSCRDCLMVEVERRRQAIIDGYREGLLATEIAEQHGIPVSTVRNEACRLRKRGIDVPLRNDGRWMKKDAA